MLPGTSPALHLVQRLRDEAHRFAITYHRSLRGRRRQTRSAFDDLPGVGPERRGRALLRAFGSVKRVREATVEEIAGVPGIGPGARGAGPGRPGGRLRPRRTGLRRHEPAIGSRPMRRITPIIIIVVGLSLAV